MTAFIDATQFAKIQFKKFQEDNQIEKYGFLDAAVQSTAVAKVNGLITPEVEATLRSLEKTTHEIPARKEQTLETTDVESFVFPLNPGENENFTATKFTISTGFGISDRSFVENIDARTPYLGQKFFEASKAMANKKDQIIRDILNTRRTQVLDNAALLDEGSETWNFNTGTDELEVDQAAQQGNFYYKTDQLARSNFQEQPFVMITNKVGLTNVTSNIMSHGVGNDFNRQDPRNIPFPILESPNQTIVGGTDRFVAHLLQMGGIGLIDNITHNYANKRESFGAEGRIQWGVTNGLMPYLNSAIPFLYRDSYGDNSSFSSGSTNLKVDILESWKFHHIFYIITSYNQDLATRPNNIIRMRGSLA